MEETKELITTDDIRSKVYTIRGQQVMLDKDLAEIYGYEVKKLNQQVKRNIERFPEDFMFRLSNSEIDSVRSQIVTSRKKDFFAGQEGGRRYLPYAFTEQENTVQEVENALQGHQEALQRAAKSIEKQSNAMIVVMKQKVKEMEEGKDNFLGMRVRRCIYFGLEWAVMS